MISTHSIAYNFICFRCFGMDLFTARLRVPNRGNGGHNSSSEHHSSLDFDQLEYNQASQLYSTQPMVLSLVYAEQIGNALKNLFDLQCWAQSVNITKVVEPCIYTSGGKVFQCSKVLVNPYTKFQDIFNISRWNQVSSVFHRSNLVSMNDFLRYASKKVTYVQIIFEKKNGCKSLVELADMDWFKLLENNGFRISTVCIKLPKSGLIADHVFQKKVFGTTNIFQPNTTIIFEEWHGLHPDGNFRLGLTELKCHRLPNALELVSIPPPQIVYSPNSIFSSLLRQQFYGYVDKFVSDYMHGEQYVVVMLRSERLEKSVLTSPHKLNKCAEGIMSDYNKALDQIKGTKTLLCTDTGNHGSRSLSWHVVARNLSLYLQDNLNLELSPKELDSALEKITKSDDSMLIAMLQSLIATRATCIVVVGGGVFQSMTMNTYAQRHEGHECYYFRSCDCNPHYISTVL